MNLYRMGRHGNHVETLVEMVDQVSREHLPWFSALGQRYPGRVGWNQARPTGTCPNGGAFPIQRIRAQRAGGPGCLMGIVPWAISGVCRLEQGAPHLEASSCLPDRIMGRSKQDILCGSRESLGDSRGRSCASWRCEILEAMGTSGEVDQRQHAQDLYSSARPSDLQSEALYGLLGGSLRPGQKWSERGPGSPPRGS